MDENKYLEAARLIVECKPSKLPYVLALLKQGGFDLDAVSNAASEMSAVRKKEYLAAARSENQKENWEKTDDPDILLLRSAFSQGLNISKLSSASGIGRTTIYKFIAAAKPTSKSTRDKLVSAFRALE